METNKMTCELCRKPTVIDDIKYIPKGAGKIALCPDCREKARPKEKPKQSTKEIPEKVQYYCTKCNFRFKTDSFGQVKLGCPYCGKSDNVVKYSKLDADEIIKSSEEK